MTAIEVDERDAVLESDALGYRVFFYDKRDGSISAYDVEAETPGRAEKWAVSHAGGRLVRIAARISVGTSGVHIVWLTPEYFSPASSIISR